MNCFRVISFCQAEDLVFSLLSFVYWMRVIFTAGSAPA